MTKNKREKKLENNFVTARMLIVRCVLSFSRKKKKKKKKEERRRKETLKKGADFLGDNVEEDHEKL